MKTEKMCYTCKIIKPLSEFYVNNSKKDGYGGVCKECTRLYQIKNKEKISEYGANHYKNNIERYKENYKKNIDHIKVVTKIRYEKIRDKKLIYYREYNEANRDKRREQSRIQNKTEKGKLQNKRAKYKRRLQKEATKEIYNIKDIFYKFSNNCFNCGKEERLEIDHNIPLSLGGNDKVNNLVLLCRSCNARKSKRLPKDFYSEEKLEILVNDYGIVL